MEWLSTGLVFVIVVLCVIIFLMRIELSYLDNRNKALQQEISQRNRAERVHGGVVKKVRGGKIEHFPFGPNTIVHRDDPDYKWDDQERRSGIDRRGRD